MTLFRGWVVVAAVFAPGNHLRCCLFVFRVFSSFQREFSAARGDVSSVFALCGLIYFTLGAVTGSVADRIGPRALVLAGFVILAAGLYAASRATSLSALYATYSIGVGLGVGCVYVPAVAAVQPWFIRRRALASGLAASGIGVGTLVVPLIVVWIIEASDWRRAFEWMAADRSRWAWSPGVDRQRTVAPRSVSRRCRARSACRRTQAGPARHQPAQGGAHPGILAVVCGDDAVLCRPVHPVRAPCALCARCRPYAADRRHADRADRRGVDHRPLRTRGAGRPIRATRPARGRLRGGGGDAGVWMASTGVVALALFALAFGTFYGTFVAASTRPWISSAGAASPVIAGTAAGIISSPTLAGFADLQAATPCPSPRAAR
jgi:MFS family permease